MFTFPVTMMGAAPAASGADPTDTYGLFDGIDDNVWLSNSLADLKNVAGASLAAWIMPNSFSAVSNVIYYSNGVSAGSARAQMYTSSGGKLIAGGRSSDADSFQAAASAGNLSTGVWSHVVATFNYADDELKLYINGALDKTQSASFSSATTSNTNSATARISNNINNQQFDGRITGVKSYDKVLSVNEIDYIYNNGAFGTNPGTANLQGHWKFDEGSGTTVGDSSGNGNDGTAVNINESTFWNP